MSTVDIAPFVLQRRRELIEPALRAAVGRLDPELARYVAYHVGWVDAQGRPEAGNGGKCLRPALSLLSAEAAGASPEAAVPAAVAVELIHNFSLLHDDVMDHDTERRHRRTVWAQFGVGPAILAGDALLVLALQILGDGGGERVGDATRRLLVATQDMIAGQAQDMALESEPAADVERCLQMTAGKTAALLGCATAIGAEVAGAPVGSVRALEQFGWNLGVAFQAVDDLLGIWGDPALTGKPPFSDLRERKRSLPVTFALTDGGSSSRQLAELFRSASARPEDLERAALLVEEAGGRATTEQLALRHLDAALAALDAAALLPAPTEELRVLARFVCERDR